MRKAVSNLFQSTLPRRGRRGRHDHQRRGGLISIHAPAKGATSRILGVPPPLDFNPRSREGSDGGPAPVLARVLTFQSTLPRRERHPYSADRFPSNQDFNPRSREGSDCVARTEHRAAAIFNPRSREGATGGPCRKRHSRHFNPRSREGATVIFDVVRPLCIISIHAPAKERPAYP